MLREELNLTESKSVLILAAAIVFAGVAVGSGLYFGLAHSYGEAPTSRGSEVATGHAKTTEAKVLPPLPDSSAVSGAPSGAAQPPVAPAAAVPAGSGVAAVAALGLTDGPSMAPPPGTQVPPIEPGKPLSPAQVQALAIQTLEARKPDLVARCWKGLPTQAGRPAGVKLTLNATIGTDGKVLALGVEEQRGAS